MNVLLVGALVLYVAFLGFYAVWSFLLGYHLLRFGPNPAAARGLFAVYVGITALLLIISAIALARVGWSSP